VLTTVFALFLLILLQSWGDLGSCGSWALTGKYATPGGWAAIFALVPGPVAAGASGLFFWKRRSIWAASGIPGEYAKLLTPFLKLSILAAALQFIPMALFAAELPYNTLNPYNDPDCYPQYEYYYDDAVDAVDRPTNSTTLSGESVCEGFGYGKTECLALGTSADETEPCCQWDRTTVPRDYGWPSADGTDGTGACWSNIGGETCNIREGASRRQGMGTALSMIIPMLLASFRVLLTSWSPNLCHTRYVMSWCPFTCVHV